jgi:hypothetical protein
MKTPLRNYNSPNEYNECAMFGAIRKYDIHTGIDLYCNDNDRVYSDVAGIIHKIHPFTGVIAESPWWNDTYAVQVKYKNIIVLYGEIIPRKNLKIGQKIKAGQWLGNVKTVLKKDKGLPMTMLHIEMYNDKYDGEGVVWKLGEKQPEYLLDPSMLDYYIHMDNYYKQDKKYKNEYKRTLKGLINVSGLFKSLKDEMTSWDILGIVDIVLTDEKTSGYSSYQHARIINDDMKLLYLRCSENEIRNIDHYYVWQRTDGEDCYSGYCLYPLKNGKYIKIMYSC